MKITNWNNYLSSSLGRQASTNQIWVCNSVPFQHELKYHFVQHVQTTNIYPILGMGAFSQLTTSELIILSITQPNLLAVPYKQPALSPFGWQHCRGRLPAPWWDNFCSTKRFIRNGKLNITSYPTLTFGLMFSQTIRKYCLTIFELPHTFFFDRTFAAVFHSICIFAQNNNILNIASS